MEERKPDILELLIRHELSLKQLYELFAARFPTHREFWQRIAEDEQRHAGWLETLRADETLIKWFLSSSPFRPQAIQTSIGYVETQIEKTRTGGMNLLEALSISRDLESALLEKQFSQIRGSVPGQIGPILTELAEETLRHRNEIAEALAVEKR